MTAQAASKGFFLRFVREGVLGALGTAGYAVISESTARRGRVKRTDSGPLWLPGRRLLQL